MAFGARGGDRDQVIERAQALAQRGAVGRAIALLEEHVAASPSDDRALLRLADYRRRVGDDAGAVDAFARTAALYAARGFASKVTAVLQQALQLSPEDPALLERMADAKAAQGLPRDAARCLDALAQSAASAGDRPRALALRRKIHALLPGDAGAALRLADALVGAGARDEAVATLEGASALVEESVGTELWLLLQERLADLAPGDRSRALGIARVLLRRGAPKRALARLKGCLAAAPDDVEALELLAQSFSALNQADKVVAAWREIAKVHQRAGRADEARAAWTHLRELSPGDAEAAAVLAPPLPPRDPGATLEEDLAEADFFASQGLADEARAVLLRLRELYPGAPGVDERLEALDVETVPMGELIAADEEPVDATVLEEESTTAILDRAAPPPAAAPEDAAAQRDLAETLIEMDRFDEALAALSKALTSDPSLEGACLALVGRCHLARGLPREAIASYRLALASPTLSHDEAVDVLCELGHALELTGQPEEALRCFEEARRLEPSMPAGEESLLGATVA